MYFENFNDVLEAFVELQSRVCRIENLLDDRSKTQVLGSGLVFFPSGCVRLSNIGRVIEHADGQSCELWPVAQGEAIQIPLSLDDFRAAIREAS